jgi:hypothetical protein
MSGEHKQLSPADQAYCIQRSKQLVQLMAAAKADPQAKLELAKRIFDDAFTDEIPQAGAVLNSRKQPMKGHARRDTVPEMPPPPQVYEGDDAKTELEQAEYDKQMLVRAAVISNNERKLRALLWARGAFLEVEGADSFHAHTLESAIREWFLCSWTELPTSTQVIELCVKANARASWSTLQRVARERLSDAAQ